MIPGRRKAIQDGLLRLADGDRSAMPELVRELWPVLLSFAQRGLRDRHDAEDVAQEVLLRICSRISEFDRTRDALSWAFGIATFEIMTQRRRVQRRKESFSIADLPDAAATSASVEEEALRAELLAILHEVFSELSAQDLAQLTLDSATTNGAASPATRKRRQRALGRLRLAWRKIYGES